VQLTKEIATGEVAMSGSLENRKGLLLQKNLQKTSKATPTVSSALD